MNADYWLAILLVLGLAVLPTVITTLICGPGDWEPEEQHDLR